MQASNSGSGMARSSHRADWALRRTVWDLLAVALLLLGIFAIYGRVSGFDYAAIDDAGYVQGNSEVRDGLTLSGLRWAFTETRLHNWHPLTWISHMIDVSLFGPAPGPQHVVNALIHGANSVLVYLLALALIRHWLAAVVVALLFLVHPLHVESVAWIAERKDVLCGFFYLLGTLCYLRWCTHPSRWRYLQLIVVATLALLAKPMAVTFPIVLLLLDYWPLNRLDAPSPGLSARMPSLMRRLLEKLPLFALSLGCGLITVVAQRGAMADLETLSIWQRAMGACVAYATYLFETLLPLHLGVLHAVQPIDPLRTFLPCAVLLAAITLAVFRARRHSPWLLFGWLWFVLTLLPVIGLIKVGTEAHSDRYMYLPSFGLFMAVGPYIARAAKANLFRAATAFASVVCFYGFLAWIQVGYWANTYLLFTHAIEVAGERCEARINLSAYFLSKGVLNRAEENALLALQLNAREPMAYTALGGVRMARGDNAGAELAYRQALALSPHYATASNNLGIALEHQGRLDEAKASFEQAQIDDPKQPQVRENLARVGARR
jgi:hypothetical protein